MLSAVCVPSCGSAVSVVEDVRELCVAVWWGFFVFSQKCQRSAPPGPTTLTRLPRNPTDVFNLSPPDSLTELIPKMCLHTLSRPTPHPLPYCMHKACPVPHRHMFFSSSSVVVCSAVCYVRSNAKREEEKIEIAMP